MYAFNEIKEKNSERELNLVLVYNLKSKQLLIHALAIPKGLPSVAITTALYLVRGINSLKFQYSQLIPHQARDH